MKIRYKTPQFGDEQGIWVKFKDNYSPLTIRAWDYLFNKGCLEKVSNNRWKYVVC